MIGPAEVEQARAWQEQIMLDTVVVERRTGSEYDPATMTDRGTWATVYTGPARVQSDRQQARDATATGTDAAVAPVVAAIPWRVTDVQPGDRLTVTTAALDPALTTRPVWVQSVEAGTYATCRRLHCTTTEGVSR